jgi:DNA helicase-2/ATP-dependent DNA helicase PcrA
MTEKSQEAERYALNAEQAHAVEHGEGPLLVVAGAGTGKTRVITERIKRLLEADPSLRGENILGLTFTDKAAGEMKYRVVKSVGERAEGVWLSTFHKFCFEKILRAVNSEIQVLEETDHHILLRRHIAELELHHFRRLQEPGEFLSDFVKFFGRCQDELVSPDRYQAYAEELRRQFESRKRSLEPDARAIAEEEVAKQEELARVYRTSTRLLRERNFCTFGEQLMKAVERLREDEGLLRQMREQFRYILVDEFQDTNIAQLELLRLLAGDARNIMAVGDHNQAIYRFRGASYGSFTIFLLKFCGLREPMLGPATKDYLVSLSQNYRSTKRILKVAATVIGNNEQSPLLPHPELSTENPSGEKIRVVEFGSAADEAWWVASELDRLHEAGAAWHTMAVLYRKHTHREQLLQALQRRGIPFVIRKFSILSSTLVRDLLAWLHLIGEPGDNVSRARVLGAPYWGLEPRDLVRLAERAEKNHRSLSDELEAAKGEAPFTREGVRLMELSVLLGQLRQMARRMKATELLDELIRTLGIAPLPSDADRHFLERFVTFVREWERKSEVTSLGDFLEYLFYFDEANGDVHLEAESSDDAVQLMTVHGAKGLEYPHVFVLRLTKNDFPSGQRKVVFEFPPELMQEEKPQGDFHIQEERRLFYVALTRARKQLTLSAVVAKRKLPSPFLDDFLQDPKVQKFDTMQSSPKVQIPPAEEAAGAAPDSTGSPQLFGAAGEAARVYTRTALWAKAFHPPRPEPLQLSSSALSAYESCPMKYMLRYHWRIRGGPNAAMTFGNVMHTTVKEFVAEAQKKKVPLEEVLAIYDREWRSAGFPDEHQETEYRKEGRKILEGFHQSCGAAPADVLFQEKAFELPLEHDVVIEGRIDQINRIGRNAVEIIDYKTGKPRDAKKAAGDLQLTIYALAAKEVLDLNPERLVFYNLMNNERVETTRDAKSLKAAKEKIAELADLIRAGEFDAKPGFGCKYCDFQAICPAHEQLISIRPAPRKAVAKD